MLKELIEQLMKTRIIEMGEVIVPNAGALAHKDGYKIGVWWYDLRSGQVLYSKEYSHADVDKFKGLDKDVATWVRGRVLQYKGKTYAVIYSYDFYERELKFTGDVLASIVRGVERESGNNIEGIVDEDGHDLLGNI